LFWAREKNTLDWQRVGARSQTRAGHAKLPLILCLGSHWLEDAVLFCEVTLE
jgi:hypothetical protein